MGKSSTTTTKPWKEAQPYILGAANTLQGTYNEQAGKIADAAGQVGGYLGTALDKYGKGDATTNAAQGYAQDVVGGKYLNGNPHLQSVIDNTNNDIMNQTQASLSLKGLTGGSNYADLIAKRIAQNTSNLRYQDYGNERQAMTQAASMAPSLNASQNSNLGPALSILGTYGMPLDAASQYAGSVGGLLGNYTTTKQTQGLGSSLAGILGAGLSGWASGGFKGI